MTSSSLAGSEVPALRRPGAWLGRSRETAFAPWLVLAAALAVLVVAPVAWLVMTSLQDASGNLTLANYAEAYGSARHLRALRNSLLLAGAATLLCLVFAVPLAWAVSRTDMPGKGFIRLTVLGAFIMPPYLGAIAWILLAGPNSGRLNMAWMALTGASTGVFNIYSFAGLALVIALYTFPYVFVFASSALDVVSSEMDDAAHILGAGQLRTTMQITLPLVLPAIIAGAIVSFLETIALFGTPAIIGLPARIPVATTQLWEFFEHPIQVEVAAAYSMPLVLITLLLFWLQRTLLGRKGYAALSGKGGERRPVALGPLRWVMLGYSLLVGAMAVYLPFLVLGQAALSKAWGRGLSLANLTFGNFEYVLFGHSATQQAVVNTFFYSGTTATLAVAIGLAVAYLGQRRLVPWPGLLVFLCMAPFVIPGIVMAIAFYATYAPRPVALNGTAAIIILAFASRFLPIAYANSSAAVRSINPELEEAARILGSGRLATLGKIVAPLLKRSLAGAWILVFIPATRELSTALFLVGPNNRVISMLLLDLSEEGSFEQLAALGLILLGSTIAVVAFGFRMLGRDFMLRRS